jgi:hypothetical protein
MIALSWVALLLLPFFYQGPASSQSSSCVETASVVREAPRQQGADPLGSGPWYINSDATIWALKQPWRSGVPLKTAWIKRGRSTLTVVGRRLDANAPPLQISIPEGYSGGFQASRLMFPTPGCWEVSETAGSRTLKFVTRIGAS